VRHRGWLLDPYIRERNVVYWFKTNKGEAIKVEERHNPVIVAKPKPVLQSTGRKRPSTLR